MLLNLQDSKSNIGPLFAVNNGTVIALVKLYIRYSFEMQYYSGAYFVKKMGSEDLVPHI